MIIVFFFHPQTKHEPLLIHYQFYAYGAKFRIFRILRIVNYDHILCGISQLSTNLTASVFFFFSYFCYFFFGFSVDYRKISVSDSHSFPTQFTLSSRMNCRRAHLCCWRCRSEIVIRCVILCISWLHSRQPVRMLQCRIAYNRNFEFGMRLLLFCVWAITIMHRFVCVRFG